jgi:hypothetical protein
MEYSLEIHAVKEGLPVAIAEAKDTVWEVRYFGMPYTQWMRGYTPKV